MSSCRQCTDWSGVCNRQYQGYNSYKVVYRNNSSCIKLTHWRLRIPSLMVNVPFTRIRTFHILKLKWTTLFGNQWFLKISSLLSILIVCYLRFIDKYGINLWGLVYRLLEVEGECSLNFCFDFRRSWWRRRRRSGGDRRIKLHLIWRRRRCRGDQRQS